MAVAIADGVSSSPGAGAASASAVEAGTRYALEAAADGTGREEVVRAIGAANVAVRNAGGGATTLVIALLDATGRGALARIGDSSAFILSGGAWREVWLPDSDVGSIRTATSALPAETPAVEVAELELGLGDVLVLVTDGIADPLRDGPTTVAPGLAAALASAPDPLDLALVVDFSRRGVHDDRTLVAVWAIPPETAPGAHLEA